VLYVTTTNCIWKLKNIEHDDIFRNILNKYGFLLLKYNLRFWIHGIQLIKRIPNEMKKKAELFIKEYNLYEPQNFVSKQQPPTNKKIYKFDYEINSKTCQMSLSLKDSKTDTIINKPVHLKCWYIDGQWKINLNVPSNFKDSVNVKFNQK
jgi:hypothetical protein